MLFSRGTTQISPVVRRLLCECLDSLRANGRFRAPPTWFQRPNSGATFRGIAGTGTFTLSPARCRLSSRVLLPVTVSATQSNQSIPKLGWRVNIGQPGRTQ